MTTISITTVLLVIVCAYIFRKPLKQLNNDAPVIVENCMTVLTKSSAQLDAIVSTNCAENNLDCQKRMKAVLEEIEANDLPNIKDAYERVINGK